MGRLKAMTPRLGASAQRLGRGASDEAARLRERDANVGWRAWYKTSRWQKLRRVILARDLYTCQRTGVLLVGTYPAPDSPVVDHKVPHRGDETLFWDPANLHAVSKAFHDGEKQAEERRG